MDNPSVNTVEKFTDLRRPVAQRKDFCENCGMYKSVIEVWNECICKEMEETDGTN